MTQDIQLDDRSAFAVTSGLAHCKAAPTPQALVFLLDVDNTLLDSDRFKLDLSARLERDFGSVGREQFWLLHEQLKNSAGYADHLGTVQMFRADREDDPLLLNLAEFLLEYPFAQRLFPSALQVIAHLRAFGQTVVLTDGDRVFQPRKLRRSGIWDAVGGQVMIPLQKQYALDAMERQTHVNCGIQDSGRTNPATANRRGLVTESQSRYAPPLSGEQVLGWH